MRDEDRQPVVFYTYLHRRADDGKVFYIGKGQGKRAWSATGRSPWWKNVAGKHGLEVVKLSEWRTETDAFEHERFLIACFRDLGAPLVNLTDGGEGAGGCRPSEETNAKRRAAMVGRRRGEKHPMFGRKHAAESRRRIGEALLGRPKSEGMRARLSDTQRSRPCGFSGRRHSEEARRKIGEASRARHQARREAQ